MQSMPNIFYCIQTARGLLAATIIYMLLAISAPLLASAGSTPASVDQVIVARCDNCLDSRELAQAATDAVLESIVALDVYGSSPLTVYVTDVENVRVAPFEVSFSTPAASFDDDSGQFRSDLSVQATPIAGDDYLVMAFRLGAAIARDLRDFLADGIDIKSLETRVESAVQLAGPDDSYYSYKRRQLAMDINDHFKQAQQSIIDEFDIDDDGLFEQVPHLIWKDGDIPMLPEVFPVQFPDGTTVMARIESVLWPFLEFGPSSVRIEFIRETLRLPNGLPIPQAPGHFKNFEWDNYSHDPVLSEHLRQLAEHHGVRPDDELSDSSG